MASTNTKYGSCLWLRVLPLPAFHCCKAGKDFRQRNIQIYHFSSASFCRTVCPATQKKPQLLLSRLGYIRWTLVCWDEMWIEVGGWSESLLTSNASWKTHLDSSNTLIVKDRNGCLFLFWQILALDSLSNSFFVQRQPWQSHHRYSWNSLMKFHPENKSWHSCSCAECGFNLKTRVIAKQTPHICCRVDLFLVAGITFLTCHLWAGKFSIINHSRDTSIWGVSLIAKPQQNGSPLLRQYSSPSNYWSTLRHFVKIQTK